jgi:hypothetical protein
MSSGVELRPMPDLNPEGADALVAFLESLNGSIDAPADLLHPPAPLSDP